jgi:hypothetical protein
VVGAVSGGCWLTDGLLLDLLFGSGKVASICCQEADTLKFVEAKDQ